MSFMMYVLSFFLVLPIYLWIVHSGKVPIFGTEINKRWKARLYLASPVVWMFSPVVMLTGIMLLAMIYVCSIGDLWNAAFSKEEGEECPNTQETQNSKERE